MNPPARRCPPLAAPVDGYSAWRIALFLEQYDFAQVIGREELRGVHAGMTAEVRLTVEKIREAGREWQVWRAAVDGSAVVAVTASAGSSPKEITPEQAAVLLKVTPNRVRQLLRAGNLAGRHVGRQWLIAREEVTAYREQRKAA